MVKLDRLFVADLDTDPGHRSVLQAILQLVAALGLTPVAEGVEQAAQLELLEELGCPYVQGDLLSPPVPLAEVPPRHANVPAAARVTAGSLLQSPHPSRPG